MIEQDPHYCHHSGKAKHESAASAMKAVKALGRNKVGGNAYRCPHCNAWHHCSVSKDKLAMRRKRGLMPHYR